MRDWHIQRFERIEETRKVQQLAITENTTDMVASIDIDGFFIHLNQAGYRLLELGDREDITRLRLAGFYEHDDAGEFINRETPKAVMYGASHSEVTLRTRQGKSVPGSQVLIAHKDSLGNIECFSVIVRDISSIREAEAERQMLIEQLHQSRKMETIGRLAGGVAHDFNNFITVIMGYAELGLINAETGKTSRTELEIILDSAQKASRLSTQLLDFSSKQVIEPQILNLNEIIQHSRQLVESLLGEGSQVRMSLDYALWPVEIDRSQLEQIILNLSVNARDALDASGTLSLRTENRILSRREANRFGLPMGGDYVRFSVKDDGCGIEPDHLEQIFDPFFTTKDKGKGTGLGLSAVYGAVKQNKGHIRVNSQVGEGTTFDIFFPRASSEPAPQAHAGSGEKSLCAPTGTESILLVEDNEEVRNLLVSVLKAQGYQVLEAVDGEHALDVFEDYRNHVDLVVSDVIMPKMNGMELLRKLQTISPAVKVLLMSGHTDQVISLQDMHEGKINLLNKPFPSKKLAETVRALLDRPAGTNPLPAD